MASWWYAVMLVAAVDFPDGDVVDITSTSPNPLPSGAAERTVCFWFNADSFTANGFDNAMYANDDTATDGGDVVIGCEVRASDTTNQVSVAFDAHRVITTGTSLSTGTWYHVALIVPAGANQTDDPQIWIDGVQKTLATEAGSVQTLNTAFADCRVGGDSVAAGDGFDGRIDDVRIYTRALTSSELEGLVKSRRRRAGTSLNSGLALHLEMNTRPIAEVGIDGDVFVNIAPQAGSTAVGLSNGVPDPTYVEGRTRR
jgi:hypothetical protein